MSLATTPVGSNQLLTILLSDPASASSLQSVLSLADAKNLSGLFAALCQNVPILLNPGGTFDQQRSAVGTTGIPVVNTEGTKRTYSVGVVGFTPAATATDFWQLVGSATTVGRLLWLKVTGFATAAITVDIQLIKRSVANTGAAGSTPTIMPHDSNDAPSTCVVNTYAANPSVLGTSVGVGRAEKLNLGATGAAGSVIWDFTTRNSKAGVLRGIAQSFNLNWNGAAIPGGTTLNIEAEFSEE